MPVKKRKTIKRKISQKPVPEIIKPVQSVPEVVKPVKFNKKRKYLKYLGAAAATIGAVGGAYALNKHLNKTSQKPVSPPVSQSVSPPVSQEVVQQPSPRVVQQPSQEVPVQTKNLNDPVAILAKLERLKEENQEQQFYINSQLAPLFGSKSDKKDKLLLQLNKLITRLTIINKGISKYKSSAFGRKRIKTIKMSQLKKDLNNVKHLK